MPITINGSGTVTGISAGGLPDNVITTNDIADGAVTMVKRSEQMTLATAQASTSGTAIDFTGIPSWVKKITVMFNGVSTSGTSSLLLQLGTSGGVVSSGYTSTSIGVNNASTTTGASSTGGFVLVSANATDISSGLVNIASISGNTWVSSHTMKRSTVFAYFGGGDVALSGTLDRVRITTVNGTDTFDAGSINILYEG